MGRTALLAEEIAKLAMAIGGLVERLEKAEAVAEAADRLLAGCQLRGCVLREFADEFQDEPKAACARNCPLPDVEKAVAEWKKVAGGAEKDRG